MPFSRLPGNYTTADASLNNITSTFTDGRPGTLLLATVGYIDAAGTTNVSTITDSANNLYRIAGIKNRNATQQFSEYVYYCFEPKAFTGTNTVTFLLSAVATFRRMALMEYRSSVGPWMFNPLDKTNQATGNSTALNSGLMTPAERDELVIGWGAAGGGTITAAGSFTLQQPSGGGMSTGFVDLIETIIASTAATETTTVSSEWVMQGATFFDARPSMDRPQLWIPVPIFFELAAARQNEPGQQQPGVVATVTNAPAELVDSQWVANDAGILVQVNAIEATASFDAQTPNANVRPNAVEATATFDANNATTTTSTNAVEATASFDAQTPATSIQVNAAEAALTFAALDATVSSIAVTNAPAGLAALNIDAQDATTIVQANAITATASFDAQSPNTAVEAALLSFDAQTPNSLISANAIAAIATFDAQNATVTDGVNAIAATASFDVQDPKAALLVNAVEATLLFAALDATVSTATQTNASAVEALSNFDAQDPTTRVQTNAVEATLNFAALDPTVTTAAVTNAPAGVASWNLDAQDPNITDRLNAIEATLSFAALDAIVTTGSNTNALAGVASWSLDAFNDDENYINVNPNAALVSINAFNVGTPAPPTTDTSSWGFTL